MTLSKEGAGMGMRDENGWQADRANLPPLAP